MSSPRRSACLSLALLATLCVTTTTAQPTLPRDRGPAVPGPLGSLVDRLYSPDAKERAEGACQLGRRHADAAPAIPVLLTMLGDDVLVPAIECEMSPWLRRTLSTSPDARKWAETSPAKEAAEALGDIGNASVPGLLQALASSEWKVRKFAAYGLGEVNDIIDVAPVVAALGDRLMDSHPDVRDRSAWALGEIEHVSAVEPLLRAFHDTDARVRMRIAWALGEIEHPSAVDGLVAALQDSDAAVREKAIWALGEIESPLAVDGLIPMLSDPDAKIRRQTAWALGEIESPVAVPGLSQSLTDSDADVRRQAAWALGEIEDPSAIDELRAAARDSNSQVRRAVEHALHELGDRQRRRR